MQLILLSVAMALAVQPAINVDLADSTRQPIGLVTGEAVVPPAAEYSLAGSWQLSWDDQVGQELTGEVKTCEINLQHIGNKVAGRFGGRVAGTLRNAILEGELIHQSGGYVFVLKQHEPDYVCTYQICWTEGRGVTDTVGVWCDTKGRTGNFSVLKCQ